MTARALGWRAPEDFGRAPHRGARTAPSDVGALPRAVILSPLPPIYDQHAVGSCTAQALAGAVEILLRRQGYDPERPDRAALYRRERDAWGGGLEDGGAMVGDGVTVLRRGWEREAVEPPPVWGKAWTEPAPSRPLDAPRVTNSEALDFDAASIAWELACGHPVVVGLRVTDQWWQGAPPDLGDPESASIGGHAVCLVGFERDARRWVCRNSWGEGFGRGGYCTLPWTWTVPPWCGEVWALRAVQRATPPPV